VKASAMRSIIARRRLSTPCSLRANMEPHLADKFIGMYGTAGRWDYGEEGRRAVRELLSRGADAGLVPKSFKVEFLSDAA